MGKQNTLENNFVEFYFIKATQVRFTIYKREQKTQIIENLLAIVANLVCSWNVGVLTEVTPK